MHLIGTGPESTLASVLDIAQDYQITKRAQITGTPDKLCIITYTGCLNKRGPFI